MQIIIHTINGTYIVPSAKQMELMSWLEANAVQAGQQAVKEQQSLLAGQNDTLHQSQYLINENV